VLFYLRAGSVDCSLDCSLELDANGTLHSSSLTRLSSLTQLQQLDLGENTLTRFPTEVSNLQAILVLHTAVQLPT